MLYPSAWWRGKPNYADATIGRGVGILNADVAGGSSRIMTIQAGAAERSCRRIILRSLRCAVPSGI